MTLKDHYRKPSTWLDYQGMAMVIFFAYTTCPGVCPTTLARFAEVMKLGSDAGCMQVCFSSPASRSAIPPEKLAAHVP